MSSKISCRPGRFALGMAVSLCSLAAASASTLTTFQIDMTGAPFDPSFQTVSARGSFGSPSSAWGVLPLTNNPAGANTNLWSGTTNLPFNGGVLSYKYTIEPGTTYETTFAGGSHNRLAAVPQTSGSSLVLPVVFFSDSGSNAAAVTFQVDMAQQIHNGAFTNDLSLLYTRGIFNSWGTDFVMTNDPSIRITNQFGLVTSNVYVWTYELTNSPGATLDYKFYFDSGTTWESPAPGTGDPADNNNRFFNLTGTASQKLPIVYFNDAPYAPLVTNAVTFQVDMTAEILNGNFTPSGGYVEVRGDFNSWGTPQILCTNDPTAVNTNIYTATWLFKDGVGASHQYKFWSLISPNGGWENGNNRAFNLANTNSQYLPVVFFDNIHPSDLLPDDTVVTFSVNMTNAVGTDAHPFDPSTDSVYVNGLPTGTFASWSTLLPQLTNNPVGSGIYTLDFPMTKGTPVQQTYKYSINGFDNEAGVGANHVRFIRSTGTYGMPLDKFGTALVEQSFGNLAAAKSTPGHVLISWLGRPGVHLQSRADLSTAAWVDHLETDGLSSTNWPAGNGNLFFRLIKP